MARRSIRLTDREFEALVVAMALYEAEYGEENGTVHQNRDIDAHHRIVDKWNEAG